MQIFRNKMLKENYPKFCRKRMGNFLTVSMRPFSKCQHWLCFYFQSEREQTALQRCREEAAVDRGAEASATGLCHR